ncbi:MAG: GntR family transcriptional regulator [Candidatus Pacebacteria bacterium]|nr:GntR family transcriptional regulator [Candidatus Paceibacterota bacterium]
MPITQEQTVFDALRAGIVAGKIPVGEFLSQRKLAEQFDTSLITLRAALRRLENEGLIENVPRWGVRIPEDTPERVRDRYFVRETMETAALERALPELDETRQRRLYELAASCDHITGNGDDAISTFSAAHHALHRFLIECADSPLLLEEYDRVMTRNLMLNNARRGWGRGRDRGEDHHQSLVRTLVEKPMAEAAEALRAHIRRGLVIELYELDKGK